VPVLPSTRSGYYAVAGGQRRLDDVPSNNAGYGQFAPFEQMSAEDFKAIVDTCFYGVVNTTRAAVPVMRKQKSGHIFQVSSVGGRLAVAGNTPYHAAKWACGRFQRCTGDGSCAVRGQYLHTGARRYSNHWQGAPFRCAGPAADYEASVGSNAQDVA